MTDKLKDYRATLNNSGSVGYLAWNPTADNVLACGTKKKNINIWDVSQQE